MPEDNDSQWDPRPRLAREAEHVDGGDESDRGADKERPEADEGETASPPRSEHGSVLVELAGAPGMSSATALDVARHLEKTGFEIDPEFGAMPFGDAQSPQTFVVRGRVTGDSAIANLERDSRVVKVWRDTPVAPF